VLLKYVVPVTGRMCYYSMWYLLKGECVTTVCGSYYRESVTTVCGTCYRESVLLKYVVPVTG
jgi:hypothetical protein